jgi:pentose-5-phosphate-3-epimerase
VPDSPFLPEVLEKVRYGRQQLGGVEWVVDGGVTPENLSEVVKSGAQTVVVGRAIFSQNKIKENIAALRSAL